MSYHRRASHLLKSRRRSLRRAARFARRLAEAGRIEAARLAFAVRWQRILTTKFHGELLKTGEKF